MERLLNALNAKFSEMAVISGFVVALTVTMNGRCNSVMV